jgi:activator of HSP90 ATPase
MTNAIHQELVLDTTPERLFEIWMDSKLHGEFTGSSAKIGPNAGDAFECHEGQILGRTIEVVPGKRIVQAWRVAAWPEGVFTLLRVELHAEGDKTKLVLDHTSLPDGSHDQLEAGWTMRYWDPLRAFLA